MKKIDLTIEYCNDCPYSIYNITTLMSQSSGYDCRNPKSIRRIIDDDFLKNDKITIPSWCSLENI